MFLNYQDEGQMEQVQTIWCPIHHYQIQFLDLNKGILKGERTLCRQCKLVNPTILSAALMIVEVKKQQELMKFEKEGNLLQISLGQIIKQFKGLRKDFNSVFDKTLAKVEYAEEEVQNTLSNGKEEISSFGDNLTLNKLQDIAEILSEELPIHKTGFIKLNILDKFNAELMQVNKIGTKLISLLEMMNDINLEIEQVKELKYKVLLTGFSGCGSTTIFNKICNENQKTCSYPGMSALSTTKDVTIKQTAYGKGFMVIDTPGFEEKGGIYNATAIKCTFNENPVNQILVVIRYFLYGMGLFMVDCQQLCNVYKNYKNLITVIVTIFGDLDDDEKQKQKITETLKQFGIFSVLFIYENDSGNQICQNIDQILAKNKVSQIIGLTELDYYQIFYPLVGDDEPGEIKSNAILANDYFGEITNNAIQETTSKMENLYQYFENPENSLPFLNQFLIEINQDVVTIQTKYNEMLQKVYRECKRIGDAFQVYYLLKQIIYKTKMKLVISVELKILELDKNFQWKNDIFTFSDLDYLAFFKLMQECNPKICDSIVSIEQIKRLVENDLKEKFKQSENFTTVYL